MCLNSFMLRSGMSEFGKLETIQNELPLSLFVNRRVRHRDFTITEQYCALYLLILTSYLLFATRYISLDIDIYSLWGYCHCKVFFTINIEFSRHLFYRQMAIKYELNYYLAFL